MLLLDGALSLAGILALSACLPENRSSEGGKLRYILVALPIFYTIALLRKHTRSGSAGAVTDESLPSTLIAGTAAVQSEAETRTGPAKEPGFLKTVASS